MKWKKVFSYLSDMRSNQVMNLNDLRETRKTLRNASTPAESRLWKHLRNNQLQDRKFRRQHSIEKFVVDFYCPAEKLIVELDGAVHNEPMQAAYDKGREERLTELGFTVLRFSNEVVFNDISGVLQAIASHFMR